MEGNDKKQLEKRVRETRYLIQAVTVGNDDEVKKLLNGTNRRQYGKWSGDVNAKNIKGETLLTIATKNDFEEIVKLLEAKRLEEAENRLSFATSGLSPESPVNYLDTDVMRLLSERLVKGGRRKRSSSNRKRSRKKVERKKRKKKKKKTRKRRKTGKKKRPLDKRPST